MSKKTFMATIIISAFLISFAAGMQAVKVAKANPTFLHYGPPEITVISPVMNETYNSSNIPLKLQIQLFGYSGSGSYFNLEEIALLQYSIDTFVPVQLKPPASNQTESVTIDQSLNASTILTGLSDGKHIIRIEVETTYGQSSDSNVSFVVDTTPPSIQITQPENTIYSGDTGFKLTVIPSEPTSWIGYSIDCQANMTLTGSVRISGATTGLNDGYHNITVYANDTAGNMGKSETVYFTQITLHAAATPTPSPSLPPTEAPTQQPTTEPSPKPNNQKNFTPILIVAALVVAVVVVGLLVYFRKRRG